MQPQRWEYKLVDSRSVPKSGRLIGSRRSSSIESFFNSLGRQGWELIEVEFFDMKGLFRGVARRELLAPGTDGADQAGAGRAGTQPASGDWIDLDADDPSGAGPFDNVQFDDEQLAEALVAASISAEDDDGRRLEITIDDNTVMYTTDDGADAEPSSQELDRAGELATAVAAETVNFLTRIEALLDDADLADGHASDTDSAAGRLAAGRSADGRLFADS